MTAGETVVVKTSTGSTAGRKGRETRQRLLAEVERHCVATHHSSVTVQEIARGAGSSPATFYHYFPDVATAAAEVAQAHLAGFENVLQLARDVVRSGADLVACREFAAGFNAFWMPRPGLLEAISTASVDEDPRFFRVLHRAIVSLTHIFSTGVRSGPPEALAATLAAMLCQSTARRSGFIGQGMAAQDVVEAQAHILCAALQREDPGDPPGSRPTQS